MIAHKFDRPTGLRRTSTGDDSTFFSCSPSSFGGDFSRSAWRIFALARSRLTSYQAPDAAAPPPFRVGRFKNLAGGLLDRISSKISSTILSCPSFADERNSALRRLTMSLWCWFPAWLLCAVETRKYSL